MEQEQIDEQAKQNSLVPFSNCTISQTIILGRPPYLAHKTTRSVTSRETRRIIFEYLKLLWTHQTDALSIAKRKRELGQPLYQREKELLDIHEDKCPTQNRWNNKSPFKRQRHN